MRITKTELINNLERHTSDKTELHKVVDRVYWAEELAQDLSARAPFVVFPFSEAPEAIRNVCNYNGGDEDWLVIARKEPDYLPNWLERMSPDDDLDTYVFDGVVVYVGSHS